MAKRKYPKVVYYKSLEQEFENNHLERKDLPNDYKYIRTNKFLNGLGTIFYFMCMFILKCFCRINLKVKIKNKKLLKKLKKQGFFIYMNHTSDRDPFVIQSCVTSNRKTLITGYSDALNLPHIGKLIPYLGLLPLPNNIRGLKKFNEAINTIINKQHKPIIIFPERQMWPFCAPLRDFNDSSFHYPAQTNAPIVPIVTIYRQTERRIKKDKPPLPTLVVCDPIYPDKNLSVIENKKMLHQKCVEEMKKTIEEYNSYSYVTYIQSDDENAITDSKISLRQYYREILKKEKLEKKKQKQEKKQTKKEKLEKKKQKQEKKQMKKDTKKENN